MTRFFDRWRSTRVALVVAVLLLGGTSAWAQGFYYKEIRKDGRIYVFNIAANAARFEASGEMGVGLTRPGAGPAGETVVGDNERALQLFFFKHGIAEVVQDPPPPAAPAPPGRLSGLMFGDYYAFPEHHLETFENQHGFWFRRIYFQYDHTASSTVALRFRFEMNSNGKLAGGSLTPFVKDAYLRWTFVPRHQLTLGIHPSLTFEFIESVWGLRHIEKTPLDLYRVDSSRDTGVTVSGPLNASQTVKYAVQYGNESGNNAETDKFKSVRATVRYETNPGFSIEGFAAHFSRNNNADRTTGQLFVGYRARPGRVGFQYSYQKRNAAAGTTAPDVELDILSGFGVFDIVRGKSSVFVRVDRFNDPCADCPGIDYLPIDNSAPFTFALVGVEYFIVPTVRISPNVELVAYRTPPSGDPKPKNDVAFRLTYFWTW
jgi:hypothetical protein